MTTVSENSVESLSFDSGTANRNIWNDLLNPVTHYDFGDRIQLHLEDEELGRLGLRCHFALDTRSGIRGALLPLLDDVPDPCTGSLVGVQACLLGFVSPA